MLLIGLYLITYLGAYCLLLHLQFVDLFCKFLVLLLCNVFSISLNHAFLLNFVSFSQLLFQDSSTLFLVGVSFTVILLPLKFYTDFGLLTNLLLMTCLRWVFLSHLSLTEVPFKSCFSKVSLN